MGKVVQRDRIVEEPAEKPIPHPLTPEANKPAKPGEISEPTNQVAADEDK